MILRDIKKQAYEKKTRKNQTSPLKMLRKSNYWDIFIQSFFIAILSKEWPLTTKYPAILSLIKCNWAWNISIQTKHIIDRQQIKKSLKTLMKYIFFQFKITGWDILIAISTDEAQTCFLRIFSYP